MIEDLDASIEALLKYELEDNYPDLKFTFEAPDDDFPSGVVTTPVVDIFLYDVQEDLELRHNERFSFQGSSPTSVTVSREPVLVQCNYLITVWVDSIENAATSEQMIASEVIKALYRYVSIPDTLPHKIDPENGEPVRILQGTLEGAQPLPRAFTIQIGQLQNPSEFWSAMGGKPKTQFHYRVTFPMDVFEPYEIKLVNRVNLTLGEDKVPEPQADKAVLQLLVPDDEARLLAASEFLVNTFTGSSQTDPAAAGLSDDGFVVLWNSSDSATGDPSLSGIAGQRYGVDGTPLANEFLVNTYTVSNQVTPSVSPLASGGFVVVWSSADLATGDTSPFGIAGQLYSSEGVSFGDEFLINTNITGFQSRSEVVTLADGSFVVVWEGAPADPAGGIAGRHFYADGTPQTDEFLVNTNTGAGVRDNPRVGALADGGFVVVWTTGDTTTGDTDSSGIAAQRYDANSVRVGGEFLVNTHTVDRQNNAAVLGLIDGDFIVAWESEDPTTGDSDNHGISAKRYDVNGDLVEDEFLVNTYTTDGQFNPNLVNLADGGFLISWWSESAEPGFGLGNIAARRYGRDGLPMGDEFRVNINTADTGSVDAQREPAVAALSSGGFVIAWPNQTPEGDTDSFGITARQYQFADTLIVDVLANDTDPDPDDILTLDSVTVSGGLGQAWIVNNRLVFYAGTDFDYLDEGETTAVTVCYDISDDNGRDASSSVKITVLGR